MKTRLILFFAALALAAGCTCGNPRIVEDFNFDWEFKLNDDSSWRPVHLPHDWSIEGQFSEKNPSTPDGGALPGGMGLYRKHFRTPEGIAEGRKCYLEFDGVFMNSTVSVNGKPLGKRPYGYSSFSYDVTGCLAPEGEDNLVEVLCDNTEQPNSRWYAGCGIYRDVRIVTVNESHIAYSGIFVTTPQVSSEKALIRVQADVEGPEQDIRLCYKVLDAKGRKVAFSETPEFEIKAPRFWDVDDPYQYTLLTYITKENKILDCYPQKFGIRTFSFDKDKGFILNGRSVKMKGVCLHHDAGCIGSAVHRRALERELGILKEMGVNAVRTSHNPPAPQLLDLCDEMGLLVMDESFDMWRKQKTAFDYARFFEEWHEKDLSDFVKRDRNHPSIVMWSIGNEVPEQMDGDLELPRHLAGIIRSLDSTRYITSGCDAVYPSNNLYCSGALDVLGLNYHSKYYDSVRVWFPEKPIIGSETTSAINSRGVYHHPATLEILTGAYLPEGFVRVPLPEDNQLTAYDVCRVPWGDTAEDAWYEVRERDFVAGMFIWTGFDYLGEPTPFGWPSRSSYFGVVDLAGFPKDTWWMYKSEWTDETVLHLLPHWNWNEGDAVDVWAYYNNADEVELFLNGKSFGRSRKEGRRLHAEWRGITFEPGTLEAVSYKDGAEVARDSRITAGEAVALQLSADRSTIKADGYDLSYISVTAIDAQGREVPTADAMLHFSVSGAGELFGVDNGNAAGTLSLKGNDMPLFAGKALAVVRSLPGEKGSATLHVTAYGSEFELTIKAD